MGMPDAMAALQIMLLSEPSQHILTVRAAGPGQFESSSEGGRRLVLPVPSVVGLGVFQQCGRGDHALGGGLEDVAVFDTGKRVYLEEVVTREEGCQVPFVFLLVNAVEGAVA
jgi:hypothetical protein